MRKRVYHTQLCMITIVYDMIRLQHIGAVSCWQYVEVYDKRVYAVYDTAPTYCQHIVNCAVTTYIYIDDMNMSIVLLRIYLCL